MTPKPRTKPDRTAPERMIELTRRLVAVPKAETQKGRRKRKKKKKAV